MATLEDIIAAYEEQGVDPTMADLSAEYMNSLGALSNNTPNRQLSQRGPGTVADLSMSIAASNVNTLVGSVDRLSSTLDRFLGALNQSQSRTAGQIDNLISLQRQTQMQISQNQIPMARAQMINPSAYGMAPGIEYQTAPGMALFRQGLPSGITPISGAPSSSFMGDMITTTPSLRRLFYEPTYTENAYMSYSQAIARRQERAMSLMRGASAMGAGIMSSAPAFAMVKGGIGSLAGSALTRLGMGTALAGPIGTAAAIGDIGLSLFGLPSVSGAMFDAGSTAWGATAGRYFSNMDMSRDISNATKFITGPSAGAYGQGLSLERSARIVSGLRRMNASDTVLNMNDYMGIFTESANQGLFNNAANEEQMLKHMRSISKNIRLFMRISGDQDYKNAISAMGEMHRLGIPVNQLGSAASNVSTFARMAGMSVGEASTFGQQGALIYQQAGANAGLGYRTGFFSRAAARSAVQSGNVSPAVLAYLGGEEGLAQNLTTSMGAFMGGPFGNVLLAGALNVGKGGSLSVNQEVIRKLATGDFSMSDLINRSRAVTGNKEAMTNFLTQKTQLAADMSSAMDPTAQATALMRFIEIARNRTGLGYEAAAQMVLGEQQGMAFTRTFSPGNVRAMQQSMRMASARSRFNLLEDYRKQTGFFRTTYRAFTEAAQGLLGGFDRRSERDAFAMEQERMQSLGMLPKDFVGRAFTFEGYQTMSRFLPGMDLAGDFEATRSVRDSVTAADTIAWNISPEEEKAFFSDKKNARLRSYINNLSVGAVLSSGAITHSGTMEGFLDVVTDKAFGGKGDPLRRRMAKGLLLRKVSKLANKVKNRKIAEQWNGSIAELKQFNIDSVTKASEALDDTRSMLLSRKLRHYGIDVLAPAAEAMLPELEKEFGGSMTPTEITEMFLARSQGKAAFRRFSENTGVPTSVLERFDASFLGLQATTDAGQKLEGISSRFKDLGTERTTQLMGEYYKHFSRKAISTRSTQSAIEMEKGGDFVGAAKALSKARQTPLFGEDNENLEVMQMMLSRMGVHDQAATVTRGPMATSLRGTNQLLQSIDKRMEVLVGAAVKRGDISNKALAGFYKDISQVAKTSNANQSMSQSETFPVFGG